MSGRGPAAPFTVLHVCLGNICRSPMAERLLAARARERAGDRADELVRSASAGTGGWHEGEPMNPPAAWQLRARGGDDTGFTARRLLAGHVDDADLVLTATAEQAEFVGKLCPDAGRRTFVLGEFGRLLGALDLGRLPPPGLRPAGAPPAARPAARTPDGVYARGVALVEAADALRAGSPPLPADDLDDPWGRGDAVFVRVADDVDAAVRALAAALLG
jgi:protein-tyrosine phosphatase